MGLLPVLCRLQYKKPGCTISVQAIVSRLGQLLTFSFLVHPHPTHVTLNDPVSKWMHLCGRSSTEPIGEVGGVVTMALQLNVPPSGQ